MSNWGIGLLFTFGPGGQPEVLVLRDVEAHCPACGKEAIMRYYDALPFHTLTVRALRVALDGAGSRFAAECAQCEASVGPEDVVRWVLHYGFPSMRGLVQGFADAGGERRWLLSPHEQIDVQLVPRWHLPDDGSRREVEALDEAGVAATFGRAFNAKEAARSVLKAALRGSVSTSERGESPQRAQVELVQLGPALALALVALGTPEEEVLEHARTLKTPVLDHEGAIEVGPRAIVADSEQRAQAAPSPVVADVLPSEWVAEPLCVAGVLAEGHAGAAAGWLRGVALEGFDVWGLANAAAVLPAARHMVRLFPVQVGFEDRGEGQLLVLLDDGQRPVIDAQGVAREAARAMLDVGDATRLELDRLLLALTGIWDGAEESEETGEGESGEGEA